MTTAGDDRMVYCVLCISPDTNDGLVHVFSTSERAEAFAKDDTERNHVFYDYVIDCPERMEGLIQ